MIWIDGLDAPFIQSLQVVSFEPYPEKRMTWKRRAMIPALTAWRAR